MDKDVLTIITNKKRDIFYMQQKDETYFRPEYRLMYTFFGGKIEDNESNIEAIKRELSEEFEEDASNIITKKLKFVFSMPSYSKNEPKEFQVFESVLSSKEINLISKTKIKEGKRGIILKRNLVESSPIIPLIKIVLVKYLKLF